MPTAFSLPPAEFAARLRQLVQDLKALAPPPRPPARLLDYLGEARRLELLEQTEHGRALLQAEDAEHVHVVDAI